MKKAQISIFIIFGVIILIVTGVAFFVSQDFYSNNLHRSYKNPEDIQDAYEICSATALQSVLSTFEERSGYSVVPTQLKIDNINASYWFSDNTSKARSIDEVKLDLEKTLLESVKNNCKINLELFKKIGTELVINNDPLINVSLNRDDTTAKVDWDITSKRAENTYNLKKIIVTEKVSLVRAIKYATEVSENFQELRAFDTQMTCNSITSNFYTYNDNTILVVIEDGLGKLSNKNNDYKFWFALKTS